MEAVKFRPNLLETLVHNNTILFDNLLLNTNFSLFLHIFNCSPQYVKDSGHLVGGVTLRTDLVSLPHVCLRSTGGSDRVNDGAE